MTLQPQTAQAGDTAGTGGRAGPLISIRGLSKAYGGLKALDNLNIDIQPNEVLALVGDNGAGKSTFIKMLSGVITPTSGTISIRGEPVNIDTPHEAQRLGIETLHQNLALVDVFNVQENIFLGREVPCKRFGFVPSLDHRGMRQRTEDLFRHLGLPLPSLDRPVRSLSGGQRQAVGIARLLLESELTLLIMDEPMAALGVEEARMVLELIANLREKGMTLLVISHNLEHVFTVADRIAIMKNGRLVDVVRTSETEHDSVVAMIVGGKPV